MSPHTLASNGGRGLKQVYQFPCRRGYLAHARQQWRARIETCDLMNEAAIYRRTRSPAMAGAD